MQFESFGHSNRILKGLIFKEIILFGCYKLKSIGDFNESTYIETKKYKLLSHLIA